MLCRYVIGFIYMNIIHTYIYIYIAVAMGVHRRPAVKRPAWKPKKSPLQSGRSCRDCILLFAPKQISDQRQCPGCRTKALQTRNLKSRAEETEQQLDPCGCVCSAHHVPNADRAKACAAMRCIQMALCLSMEKVQEAMVTSHTVTVTVLV